MKILCDFCGDDEYYYAQTESDSCHTANAVDNV